MSTLSTVMKVYEVCVAMFPILGVRIGFYYDLFTEACINDLPAKEKIVLSMYLSGVVNHLTSMSLFVCLFFILFFRYFVEKSWR